MGDKQRKLKDKASRYYGDGKLKDALKLYERIVEEDPGELGCMLKIGDIHRKLANRDAAVAAYEPVARAYAEDGLLLKAIAVGKMIMNVDPRHTATQTMLADLYSKRRGPARSAPTTARPASRQPPPAPAPSGKPEAIDLPPVVEEQMTLTDSTHRREQQQPAWPVAAKAPSTEPRPPPPASTPPPVVGSAWPVAGTKPEPTPEPAVIVGEKLEDSVLDIEVGEVLTEEEKIAIAKQREEQERDRSADHLKAPEEPSVIVGEKMEDSVLDIVVDGVLTEEEKVDLLARQQEQAQERAEKELALKNAAENAALAAAEDVARAMAEFSTDMPATETKPQDPLKISAEEREMRDAVEDAAERPAAPVEEDEGEAIQSLISQLEDEPAPEMIEEDEEDGSVSIDLVPAPEAAPTPTVSDPEAMIVDAEELEDAVEGALSGMEDEPLEIPEPATPPPASSLGPGRPIPPAEPTWAGVIKIEDLDKQQISATGRVTPSAAPQESEAPIELNRVKPKEDEMVSLSALEDTSNQLSTPQIPLFSDLPKNAFIQLLVQMEMREMEAGDHVIREGETDDSFFVLASGQVRVTRKGLGGEEVVLAKLTDGAFFGEMALLQDGARTASVIVEEESQIFEISRQVLDDVVEKFPSVQSVLRNFYKQRLLSTVMATHPLFRPFGGEERRSLMEMFKSKNFKEGSVLLREGKKGSGLYLLLHGKMKVSKEADNEEGEIVLGELTTGDMFGEMSLLTGLPTVASVVALTDCFVLRLSKRKFDTVIMTHPQVLELVSEVSEERTTMNDILLKGEKTPAEGGAVLV